MARIAAPAESRFRAYTRLRGLFYVVQMYVPHKQFSMQATAVATVNATYDWVASEAKRVMREVLDVRATERRHTVTPPVARAQQADERDGDDADAVA